MLPKIDYGTNPLVICLNPKYHNQDLSIDGLTYKRKFDRAKDVDFEICLKLLLKYKASPTQTINNHNNKRPTPIFHALLD